MSAKQDIDEINSLLAPVLFQVIGSTPASIATSLKGANIDGKKREGLHLATVAVFAAAVNKSTLETFLAKPEMSTARGAINAVLSIQGRANMTAITLLGHCLMTHSFFDYIVFVKEFRNKMGQNNLWSGNLNSGSLSDKQKGILQEKSRVTIESEARLLGSCYLKHTGIIRDSMTTEEINFWAGSYSSNTSAPISYSGLPSPTGARPTSASGIGSSQFAVPRPSGISPPTARRSSRAVIGNTTINYGRSEALDLPADVVTYRRNILQQSDEEIGAKAVERGVDKFVTGTRELMTRDPDGSLMRRQGSTAG
jgi:hypothetical protein